MQLVTTCTSYNIFKYLLYNKQQQQPVSNNKTDNLDYLLK